MKDVVVIGGGLAGAEAGARVRLYEMRPASRRSQGQYDISLRRTGRKSRKSLEP